MSAMNAPATDDIGTVGLKATARARRSPSVLRVVLAVVLGYFVYAAVVALGFGLILVIGGEERILEPNSWRVVPMVEVLGIVVAAIGAFFAGTLCRLVTSDSRISMLFSVLLLVMVSVQGISRFRGADADARRDAAERSTGSIAQNVQPGSIALVGLPLAAAVMSLAGGGVTGRVQRFFAGG